MNRNISLTTWYHQYVQCSVFVVAHPHYTAQPQMRWSKPFPPSGASTGWIDSHGPGNHSWVRVKSKNYCRWAKLGTNLSYEGWKENFNIFISGKVPADHLIFYLLGFRYHRFLSLVYKVVFRQCTKCTMVKRCRKYPTLTGCSAQQSQREHQGIWLDILHTSKFNLEWEYGISASVNNTYWGPCFRSLTLCTIIL